MADPPLTEIKDRVVLESDPGGGGGVTDHGALTGLGDDDHTQYALADGSRAFTGQTTHNAGLKADTISEKTAAAGVAIDGVKAKDGGLLAAPTSTSIPGVQVNMPVSPEADAIKVVGSMEGTDWSVDPNGNVLMSASRTVDGVDVGSHNHTGGANGPQITDAALSSAVGIAKGGTGQTTKAAAFDALSPATTKGDLIVRDASTGVRLAVGSDDAVLVADSSQASGLAWKAGGVRVLATDATTRSASGTTYSQIYTQSIPANLLGTKGAVRVRLFCEMVQNAGSNRTLTLKVTFGGTDVWGDAWGVTSRTTVEQGWVELILANKGATNSQLLNGLIQISSGAGSVAGVGNLGVTGGSTTQAFGGAVAKDTTLAQTLTVEAQWSSATGGPIFRTIYAVTEFLPGV